MSPQASSPRSPDLRQVLFHAAGGPSVGFGHARRCLTLAEALRRREVASTFLLEDRQLIEVIETAGFVCHQVHESDVLDAILNQSSNEDTGAVVIDSYELTEESYRSLAEGDRVPIVAIDDLADRQIDVDLIINGSAGAEELTYRCRPDTRLLLGPAYALLRPEFGATPTKGLRNPVQRALITLGGSDPLNLTPSLIEWTCKLLPTVVVDVVAGPLFKKSELTSLAQQRTDRVNVHHEVRDMHILMAAADIAICAGGQTTYELASTGTPAIAIRTAENQTLNLEALERAGTLIRVGDATNDDLEQRLANTLSRLANDIVLRQRLALQGPIVVDGRGAARVAGSIHHLMESRRG